MTSPEAPAYEPTRDLASLQPMLKKALRELKRRKKPVDLAWNYYDGEHPQLWMSEKMREVFGTREEGVIQDNFCELAIDTPLERLQVTGWTSDDEDTTTGGDGQGDAGLSDADRMQVQWEANRLHLEQEDLYRSSWVAGRSYVILWPRFDADGKRVTDPDTGVELYDMAVNDARDVYLEFGFHHGIRLWAFKLLFDEATKTWTGIFYFPEEVIRLRSRPVSQANENDTPDWPKENAFDLDPDDQGGPNEMGFLGVYEFAQNPRGKSRLHSLAPVQNKINKLEANKMVTAEFLAWGQRYAINAGDVEDDALRPRPGSILLLDGPIEEDGEGNTQPTEVGTLPAADLSNIDLSSEKEIRTFFTLARLPKHMMVNPGADPSGDAITGDEGPMIAFIEDAQQMFGGTWIDLARDLGLNISPAWADADVTNDTEVATTVKTLTDAGVPLRLALKKAARWGDEDLDELDELKAVDDARAAAASAQAMAAFAQGRTMTQVAADDHAGQQQPPAA